MGMPSLGWGGHANGRIPTSGLVDIGGGKLLQPDAARNWSRFAAAFRVTWRANLYLDGYQDAYRDMARQQQMYDRWKATGLPKNGVAKPGTSVHGWARSVDCTGYGAAGSARHLWMRENGPKYGWSWAYGRELNEAWHWDYVGPITASAGGDVVPIEEEEESMSYSLVPIANTVLVTVVSLNSGLYLGVQSGYHKELLQRVKKNDAGDPMLSSELDIVRGYLQAINPPPAVSIDYDALVAKLDAANDDETDAILAAIGKVTPGDPEAYAAAVQAILSDDFAAVQENINDQPTEFVVSPKA